MAKKNEKTELVKTESTALELAGYEQFAGQGFEGQTSDDYAIPFLGVLQPMSPQLEANPALRAGMIVNTVTGEAFQGGQGVVFVPAVTTHVFVEWKSRAQGGGFVAQHATDSPVVATAKAQSTEFGRYKTAEGNDLIETFYVYGIATSDNGIFQAVVAFTSTKIKKYKAWMTTAKTIQIVLGPGRRIVAPLFAHKYRLKTISEKNNKGMFYNWDIALDGANAEEARLAPNADLFQAAVAIKQALEAGTIKAAVHTQEAAVEAEVVEKAPF